jgi:hypothetical protein
MIGLTFKLVKSQETSQGFKEIKINERILEFTKVITVKDSEEIVPTTVYGYTLGCIADGQYIQMTEDEFLDELSYGIYELVQ